MVAQPNGIVLHEGKGVVRLHEAGEANSMVRSPDPFFSRHKEKRKKAVRLRETNTRMGYPSLAWPCRPIFSTGRYRLQYTASDNAQP